MPENKTLHDNPRPLVDHIEELRRRIIYSLIGFAVAAFVAYFFVDPVLVWLSRPVGLFIFTEPTEALFFRFKISCSLGLIFSFPFILYQGWRFVEMGLEIKEKSILRFVVPFSFFLFILGFAMAIFGVAPLATKFLLSFQSPQLRPMISIQAYYSFILWMVLGFGLLFQLPLVVLVLCWSGLVTPQKMASYRKHIIVGLLILAAVLTPGPDVVSQLILTIPSYLLFELSLLLARHWWKK